MFFVVDEVYVEYVVGDDYFVMVEFFKVCCKSWVVLCIFFKVYGFVGFRIGFGFVLSVEFCDFFNCV